MFNQDVFVELNRCLKKIFGKERVFVSLFQIATYPTGVWSFQIATKNEYKLSIDKKMVDDFVRQHKLVYYNSSIHNSSLALPNYIKDLLAEERH